ncbi:MAG: hypothetical protein GY724_11530, partial [Actinomycetia bacterium]|nr:hypothetical protein [Actinomycetes bacterium]
MIELIGHAQHPSLLGQIFDWSNAATKPDTTSHPPSSASASIPPSHTPHYGTIEDGPSRALDYRVRRPVRVPDHARASIDDQLPIDRAEVFRAHDLPEAVEALSLTDWWSLPEIDQSPGIRRFTVEAARTVDGCHL